jgi:predicted porin
MRPNGGNAGFNGLSGFTWQAFTQCIGLTGTVGIGADCFGAAQPAIRYDSPTWGGFRFETSYGTNELTAPGAAGLGSAAAIPTPDANFWDIAAFYNGDIGNFKLSAAYAYTWMETAVSAALNPVGTIAAGFAAKGSEANLHQVGATLMHAPSGLGIYGLYQ